MNATKLLITIGVLDILHPNEDKALRIFNESLVNEVQKYGVDCENYKEHCDSEAEIMSVDMCKEVLNDYLCYNKRSYGELLKLLHQAQQYITTESTPSIEEIEGDTDENNSRR